jgi:hypothetical protein
MQECLNEIKCGQMKVITIDSKNKDTATAIKPVRNMSVKVAAIVLTFTALSGFATIKVADDYMLRLNKGQDPSAAQLRVSVLNNLSSASCDDMKEVAANDMLTAAINLNMANESATPFFRSSYSLESAAISSEASNIISMSLLRGCGEDPEDTPTQKSQDPTD